MKEFKSIQPDIDIKLTTLDGKEVEVKCSYILNAARSEAIMNKFNELEGKKKDKLSGIALVAAELEYIYDKDSAWFKENATLVTLNEMLIYSAEVIGGVIKK